ncbi:hypothetical protein PVAG01_07868 [Phlyctema vagabunda]|uniref:Protamine P1 n=1 Tax=Phlyctema vagabunda TaxID=108571 RepID=A0ABR4PDM9_9HELO
MAPQHDWGYIRHLTHEPLYCSAPQSLEDILIDGSDSEETPAQIRIKRQRYEEAAQSYLDGNVPILQSASLKGPFERGSGWVNPWRYKSRKPPAWWVPESDDMLFTRANVLRWARDCGLGYLDPAQALARCKAQAQAERAAIGEMDIEGVTDVEMVNGTRRSSRDEDDSGSVGLYESIEGQSTSEQEEGDYGADSRQQDDAASQAPDSSLGLHRPVDDDVTILFSTDRQQADQSLLPGDATRGLKKQVDSQWLRTKPIKRSRWEDVPTTSTPTPAYKVPIASRQRRSCSSNLGSTSTKHRKASTTNITNSRASQEGTHITDDSRNFIRKNTVPGLHDDRAESDTSVEHLLTLPIKSDKPKSGQKRKRVPGLGPAQAIWEALQPKSGQRPVQSRRSESDAVRPSDLATAGIDLRRHTSLQSDPENSKSNMEERRAYLFHEQITAERDKIHKQHHELGRRAMRRSSRQGTIQIEEQHRYENKIRTPGLVASQSSFVTEVAPSTRGLGTFQFRRRKHDTMSEGSSQTSSRSLSPERQVSLPVEVDTFSNTISFAPINIRRSPERGDQSKYMTQTRHGELEPAVSAKRMSQIQLPHLKDLIETVSPVDEQFATPTATPKIPTPKLPTPFGFGMSFGIGMFDATSINSLATKEPDVSGDSRPVSTSLPLEIPTSATPRKASLKGASVDQISKNLTSNVSASGCANPGNIRPTVSGCSDADTQHDHSTTSSGSEKVYSKNVNNQDTSSPQVPSHASTSPEGEATSNISASKEDSPETDESSEHLEEVQVAMQKSLASSSLPESRGESIDSSSRSLEKEADKMPASSSNQTPYKHPKQPESTLSPVTSELHPRLSPLRVYVSGKVLSSSPQARSSSSTSQKPPGRTPRPQSALDKPDTIDHLDSSTQSYDSADATSTIEGSPYWQVSSARPRELDTRTAKNADPSSPSSQRRRVPRLSSSDSTTPRLENRLVRSSSNVSHASQSSLSPSQSRRSAPTTVQSPFQLSEPPINHNVAIILENNNSAVKSTGEEPSNIRASNEEPQSPWADENDETVQTAISPHLPIDPVDTGSMQAEELSGQGHNKPEDDWQQADQSAVLDGDLSANFVISTPVRDSQKKEKAPAKGSSPRATQLLYDESNNPWKSNLKKPKSVKSRKRVSFGHFPQNDVEVAQRSSSRLRSTSPSPCMKTSTIEDSYVDAEDENDQVTRDNTRVNKIKMPTSKYQPAESGNKYRVAGSPYKRSSPPVDAMAEAFIAADQEGSPDPSSVLREPQSSNQRTPPSHGARHVDEDAVLGPVGSFSISPGGKLKRTTIFDESLDENLDDMIGDVSAFLDGWSVEADLQKTSEKDSSQHGRKTPSTTRDRHGLFSNVWT